MYAGGAAVQPQDVADMVAGVLALPGRATVSRFDILPTLPGLPPGAKKKDA